MRSSMIVWLLILFAPIFIAVPAPLDKERNKVVKDTTARRKKPIDEEIDENNGAERRKVSVD